MKAHVNSGSLILGVAFLLMAALIIAPPSPFSQTSGFSLSLDLDEATGDQGVSSLDVLPAQIVPVQVFGEDMQNATGISLYFGYDTTQVAYVGFDADDVMPNAHTLVVQESASVRIEISLLSGIATANAGLLGAARFRTTEAFSETEIWLVRAELTRDGRSEAGSGAVWVVLVAPSPPSPDFDGSGVVDFADFLLFAGAFGAVDGDEKFDTKYDLDVDELIGFGDFVIFARRFGETVNRSPDFAATAQVTRSLLENTTSGQPIGDPVTAQDADGDSITYGLRGVHADSFAIGETTGQLLTREGVAYDHEGNDAYSVNVRATDGKGGRATVVVEITVTDVDEPPSSVPDSVLVASRDTSLDVSWLAAMDELGKPPVSGYEVGHKQAEALQWMEAIPVEGRTDTGVTITGLTNDQAYHVRVRTMNHEGGSPWSEPVEGVPKAVSTFAFTSTPASVQNGTYKLGDVIVVTATFSAAVTVTGTPQVDLTIGSTLRRANYASGSSTSALLFQYTVQATDEDTDGATINANGLKLNNGSIRKNNTTTNAQLAHGAVANQSAHKVDGIAPVLTSAAVAGDKLILSYGEALDDDPAPAPGDFSVTVEGTARNVASVGVNGSAVTLTLASPATLGQAVRLNYTPGTHPIRDRAQNPADALTNRTASNLAQGNRRPVFDDGSSTIRMVAENSAAGQDIGEPVSATDDDGHGLTYLIGGDAATDFDIDAGTGQLRTRSGVNYDHEAQSSYSLVVTADDSHGGTADIVVEIQVVDVDEPPSAPPAWIGVSEGNGKLAWGWSQANEEPGKPLVTGVELQIKEGETGEWKLHRIHSGRGGHATGWTTFANDVRVYFRIRTLNDEGTSPWSEVVSGLPTAGPQVTGAIDRQTLVVGGPDVHVDLAQVFSHPSGLPTTYDAESSNEGVATVTVSDTLATVSPVAVGYETITVSATDERGNQARTTFAVVVTTPPPQDTPTVSTFAFTSTPASVQNGTYKLGDVIVVTATFSAAVTVTGTPQVDLTIGSTLRRADYASGSSTSALLFQYTVQATDEDTDGATINANGLKLNNGSIRKNKTTTNAHLAHGAVASQSAHKVDGIAPVLTSAAVTGDKLILSYGEVLDDDPAPAPGNFSVTLDGTARNVASVGVNDSAVTLTLASPATLGQAVKLNYTPGTNPIRDMAQNPADALTNRTASNLTLGNKRPVFDDGSSTIRMVAENSAAGQDIGEPVSATDDDGHGLTYLIGGDAATDFDIDAGTGQLRTRSGANYDHEAQSSYSLVVTADDGHGGTADIAVEIQVVDVDEPPSAPPAWYGVSAGNGKLAWGWSRANEEPGKPLVTGVELQIREGETGEWKVHKIYPGRGGHTTGWTTFANDVRVYFRIRTLNDEGASPWSEVVSGLPTAGPQVTGAIDRQTLVVGGPDVRVDLAQAFSHPAGLPMTYDAESSNNDVATVSVSDTLATVSPVAVGNETITVSATDERDDQARTTFTAVVTHPPPQQPSPPPPGNNRPVFDDGTSTTRMLAENAAEGDDIGDPVSATDEDGHNLTYQLAGDDAASFDIEAGNGQLSTVSGAAYDHETKSGYAVTITADDGNGGNAAIGVTIFVVDVDEPPETPLAPVLESAANSRGLVVSPNPSPPVNTGPAITSWEIQYRVKDTDDFWGYSPSPKPDWTQSNWNVVIPFVNATWVYEVQVRASNDEGASPWSPSAEAKIPNEQPVVERTLGDLTLPAGGSSKAISLERVFSDPDEYSPTASSDNEGVAAVRVYSNAAIVDPKTAGSATVTVTATDPWGQSNSMSFDVSVDAPSLQAPSLSIADSVFTFGFTDAFDANETRSYEVRIRHKTPAGPWATKCISVTNPDNIAKDVTTTRQITASGFFEPGTTYEADFAFRGAECVDRIQGLYSPKTEATTAGTSSFDIRVVYPDGAPTAGHIAQFEAAVARWEQIITHDIPNYRLSERDIRVLKLNFPNLAIPDVVDDIMILVSIDDYVYAGGMGGFRLRNSLSSLPWLSYVSIDKDYVIKSVIMHEFGHALGFVDRMWSRHKLLMQAVGRSWPPPRPDAHFSGEKAIAAFDAAGGSGYTGFKVPLEISREISVNSHWRADVFRAAGELMGVYAVDKVSAITIQAMADIGYSVDVTQADAFTLPPEGLSKAATYRLAGTSRYDPVAMKGLGCDVAHTTIEVGEPAPFELKVKGGPESE